MTCTRYAGAIVCKTPFCRLRLADGTCVFMAYHTYLGPMFFRDKGEQREIIDWYDNPLIIAAFDWFCNREHRA